MEGRGSRSKDQGMFGIGFGKMNPVERTLTMMGWDAKIIDWIKPRTTQEYTVFSKEEMKVLRELIDDVNEKSLNKHGLNHDQFESFKDKLDPMMKNIDG